MHQFYEEKQHSYWNSCIQSHAGSLRKLWKSLNALLVWDKRLAGQASSLITAEALSEFFIKKVSDVRSGTESALPPSYTVFDGPRLEEFQVCTEEQMRLVLLEFPVKTCALDPLPSHLFQELIDDLLPFISIMSIKEGYLPASQKFALVIPVIKKPSLDPDVESNYRPISNLTLISKVIERLISRRINDHLKPQDLMPVLQSALRPFD